jgi:Lar family restriction alleviation protein
MTHEPELKPCPFCGGTSIGLDRIEVPRDTVFMYCCANCSAQGPEFGGDDDTVRERAAHGWNIRASQWQPIETAPRDGTKVFLWHQKWGSAPVGWWDWVEGPCEDGTGGFCLWHVVEKNLPPTEDGLIWPDEMELPTHWMPMPIAPVQETQP